MGVSFYDSNLKFSRPRPTPPPPPPPQDNNDSRISSNKYASSIESSESEELQRLVHAPPFWKSKKTLSKQLSMRETHRDVAWEKRRRQKRRNNNNNKSTTFEMEDITDEDLHELKGSIELGFGFNEEAAGQKLCNTLPALDLYFAVNRQLSPSPVSTPMTCSRSPSFSESPSGEDSWKFLGPGDNPQQVKTKLRHWAQAVACSVMQSI